MNFEVHIPRKSSKCTLPVFDTSEAVSYSHEDVDLRRSGHISRVKKEGQKTYSSTPEPFSDRIRCSANESPKCCHLIGRDSLIPGRVLNAR